MIEKWVIDKLNPLGVPGTQYPTVWASSGKSGRGRGGGPPTFWKQGNVAAFACQEKQMPELREAVAMQLGILMCIHQCTAVGGGDPRVHSARMRDFLASTQSLVPLRAHRDRDGVRRHAAPR